MFNVKNNIEKIQELVNDGYISVRKHPDFDYFIYNYTNSCQYDSKWCEETINCRGLILDGEYNIISRGMSKFFNYEEYGKDSKLGELPRYKSFSAYDKVDGSLGILYTTPEGELAISTRGSFESDQAKVATEILKEKYGKLKSINNKLTYLFEIIYPTNRIVVDYKDTKDLILLTIIDNETGKDLPRSKIESFGNTWKFPIVAKVDVGTFEDLLNHMKSVSSYNGNEGFVLQFDSGFRIKMKYDEYKRLHKLITGINDKAIWELLKEGKDLNYLLDKVPDEFYDWVEKTVNAFNVNYKSIEHSCRVIIEQCPRYVGEGARKLIAEHFINEGKEYSGILFAMFDCKKYEEIIWKKLKPKQAVAFKEEI